MDPGNNNWSILVVWASGLPYTMQARTPAPQYEMRTINLSMRDSYVLRCFQKKSKHGIATPQQDIELIERRLERAREHYSEWKAGQKEDKP